MDLGKQAGCVIGSNSEKKVARAELEEFLDLDENDEGKKDDEAHESGNLVQAGARSHTHCGLEENSGGRSHANYTSLFAKNYACTKKADALHDVGCNASGARVARGLCQFDGNDGEKRSCHADEEAGAHCGGAVTADVLEADGGCQKPGPKQAVNDCPERKHFPKTKKKATRFQTKKIARQSLN